MIKNKSITIPSNNLSINCLMLLLVLNYLILGLNQIVASKSPSLEIRVANRRITEDGVYFQAESSSESQWKNFKINFLASTRNDI